MAYVLQLRSVENHKGGTLLVSDALTFVVKRSYILCRNQVPRGGCAHLNSTQAVLALNGRVRALVQQMGASVEYFLESPQQLLIIEPGDWHELTADNKNTLILVYSSGLYDPNDYVLGPNQSGTTGR